MQHTLYIKPGLLMTTTSSQLTTHCFLAASSCSADTGCLPVLKAINLEREIWMAVIIPLTMDGVYRLVDLMAFGTGAI